MSRRGIKTVNIPERLAAAIDEIVEGGYFTSLSRDEFVREAASMLVMSIQEMRTGRLPMETLRKSLREFVKNHTDP